MCTSLRPKISDALNCYQVGDLGYASELGNYAEYSGAPNEEEVLNYARVVIDVNFGNSISCVLFLCKSEQ